MSNTTSISSYGPDILATGEARLVRESNPNAKVVFGKPEQFSGSQEGKSKLYWSDVFKNNPNILQPGENAEAIIVVRNYPSARPYINYDKTRYEQIDENTVAQLKVAFVPDYVPTRGEFFFSDNETAEAKKLLEGIDFPVVFLDPVSDNPNKHWPSAYWDDLIKRAPYNFVQFTYEGQDDLLDGVTRIDAKTFRVACAVLKESVGRGVLLGVDSPLHHAAAAVNLPAVVLWSHYSHPENLGYSDHINIRWDAAGDPCGLRDSCVQCKRAMEMIKVDDVLLALGLAFKEIRQ